MDNKHHAIHRTGSEAGSGKQQEVAGIYDKITSCMYITKERIYEETISIKKRKRPPKKGKTVKEIGVRCTCQVTRHFTDVYKARKIEKTRQ